MKYPQKFFRAWDTDPKATTAKLMIVQQKAHCLHCGEPLQNGMFITYTVLSNNKIIWWHKEHTISDYD